MNREYAAWLHLQQAKLKFVGPIQPYYPGEIVVSADRRYEVQRNGEWRFVEFVNQRDGN